MILTTVITVLICIFIICMLYGIYVKLIKSRNKVKEAMSGIDVQLNKRYSLIPNILTIANKFMEHERTLFEDITKLRTQAAGIKSTTPESISEKLQLDNQITSKMGQLLVSVENYPQLKSDQTMIQAMQTYSEVEEHIAAARRFYNSAVNELNNMTEIFPSSFVASLIGITSYPFFEADNEAKGEIHASDYFNK
ncbi:LemA family protein [bacterium]|nr:LemA family protein [bacterium]